MLLRFYLLCLLSCDMDRNRSQRNRKEQEADEVGGYWLIQSLY